MGVALLILKKNGSDLLREIWLPMFQWNSGTTPPKSNRTKPIPVDHESQQIPKNPEPPLINVEFYDAIEAAEAVHEVLVTVEPQGSQEVPEPLTATKPLVVVIVEPQGPEEVPEPLVENKPLEVTEDQINPKILPTDKPKKTTLRLVNLW